ncbi:MAG: helix-turn-helix domain-containing protein [Pedobacter sp.]|nr:helix-turn-helix domain-containing protein [Pedobacter sp.]
MRAQKKCAQQQVANDLIISRGRYSKYEDGKSEPPLEILKRISGYYHVSIDLMVSVDLRQIHVQDLMALEENRILQTDRLNIRK